MNINIRNDENESTSKENDESLDCEYTEVNSIESIKNEVNMNECNTVNNYSIENGNLFDRNNCNSDYDKNINSVYDNNSNQEYVMQTVLESVGDPTSYYEATHSKESLKWLSSMQDEIDQLENNKTWILVNRPKNRKVLKNLWIYKTKRDNNDIIIKHKSRLCLKGYLQIFGVDYTETFAPVIKLPSITNAPVRSGLIVFFSNKDSRVNA